MKQPTEAQAFQRTTFHHIVVVISYFVSLLATWIFYQAFFLSHTKIHHFFPLQFVTSYCLFSSDSKLTFSSFKTTTTHNTYKGTSLETPSAASPPSYSKNEDGNKDENKKSKEKTTVPLATNAKPGATGEPPVVTPIKPAEELVNYKDLFELTKPAIGTNSGNRVRLTDDDSNNLNNDKLEGATEDNPIHLDPPE